MDITSRAVLSSYTRRLRDAAALEPEVAGAKAANLARAARAGFPVLPAFVVTTDVHRAFLDNDRRLPDELANGLKEPWRELSADGRDALVVRSSSVVEDASGSSMAGQFRSVLDVRGWPAFLAALVDVLRSADRPASGTSGDAAPMAVLVQPQVSPEVSGVMFGVDPVTGDRRSILVEVVPGAPEQLVSGRVTAQRLVLTRNGRLRTIDGRPASSLLTEPATGDRPLMGPADGLRLARLARRLERAFAGPQDAEWAILDDGRLVLLQSRPVTATATDTRALTGPVLGPGPLAETFPDALSPLEEDLWLTPLRSAVSSAMVSTGAVSRKAVEDSVVVTSIDGRVAVDLELFGYVGHGKRRSLLDPRPAVRALRNAWRHGTLRAELPARVAEVVRDVDAFLVRADIRGSETDLVALLDATLEWLRIVHEHEVLAGTLLPPAERTAAGMALGVAAGLPDDGLATAVHDHPILLVLVPPGVIGAPLTAAPPGRLPADGPTTAPTTERAALPAREQLRIRARWLQELSTRTVRALARLWFEAGRLPEIDDVALLRLDEVRAMGTGRAGAPDDLRSRRRTAIAQAFSPPLPSRFRLDPEGQPVEVERRGARPNRGVPAGGGRAVGPACHGSLRRPPEPGDVLVVRHLEPGLAPLLPRISGLVAETGSTLSHLAILAREYGVPTVVNVPGALQRFPAGTPVLVDGRTGEVQRVLEGSP
jgi:pyruvate,water dikinase